MDIFSDVDLSAYSTMRLGGKAAYETEVHDRQELADALNWADDQQLPFMMIGSGSNIVWKDEGYTGLLIVNKMLRFEIAGEDELNYFCTIGAGEMWDSAVARTAQAGLTGIEALSLIPGTAGATPVQNVGAYGQEISDTLVSVEAYDTTAKAYVNIPASDCAFGYRTSRFKTKDKGRFLITSLTLHLTKADPQPPFYASVEGYFEANHITSVTPQVLREAVITIRQAKLPDPAKVANNGSFFANPVVNAGKLARLLVEFPDMPHWDASDGNSKIPAAWLVESAGFKDYQDKETGMATWPAQALVLVNQHAKTTADLLAFRQRILDAVHKKFNVKLEQEPELLP